MIDSVSATSRIRDYGSFKDSLRAPIHRWFTYPAGYSYRLVEAKIFEYALAGNHTILDPFVGTGTTSVAAKAMGVNSVGIEAHTFVHWIAKTKLHTDHDLETLEEDAAKIQNRAKRIYPKLVQCNGVWPALVYKCFSEKNLRKLLGLRIAILDHDCPSERRDFFKVALTATLRDVTSAGAGWPYIAPSKHGKRTVQRDALAEFKKRVSLMVNDVHEVSISAPPPSKHLLYNGDAREISTYVDHLSADLVLTSPPYLNNYDYADRTRLETYFWGIYDSWGEITREVRDHLMVAATTQIRRNQMAELRHCPNIRELSYAIFEELQKIVHDLSKLRQVKGGKKSYDIMVAGYFEDMLKVIKGVYFALKPGQPFILVLGDSAPYGVHVRTDELIGEMAVAVGFSGFDIQIIRTRGDKWAGNSQRHKVPLRESIVTITR